MKCVKCGAELKEGRVYCSVCGNESKIGPDYSVLEDDYLRALLREEELPRENVSLSVHKAADSQKTGKAPRSEASAQVTGNGKKPASKKKKNSRVPMLAAGCLLVLAILLVVFLKLWVDHRNANSYDYQVRAAKQEMIDRDYENALHYYKTALSLRPDDVQVRLAMAEIYIEKEEYDAAAVLLMEVIDLDAQNKTAYEELIGIYEEKEDYESIAALADGVDDIEILGLFTDYLVAVPVFSPVSGEYDEYLTVELTSLEDFDIYYTLNGKDPDTKNGTRYDEKKDGIVLDEAGSYTIRAVCVNDKGILSEIAEAEYEISVSPPAFATVSPDGGQIDTATTVTMEAEENCSIYYTWDGTDPTEASLKYEGPVEIPTGNTVLSVLVVNDQTGLNSGVYRTNFIYYP